MSRSLLPFCEPMASSHITRWWDRDVDEKGRRIRSDLRRIAHKIWDWASNYTKSRLGDDAGTAELLDTAIAQASAYLDKNAIPLNAHSESHLIGLLRRCFWTVLQRQAKQLRRLELIGGNSDLSDIATDNTWSDHIENRIDFERMIGLLSERARTVLALRVAGYDWQEIAAFFETTPGAIKKSFLRELRELQRKVRPPKRPRSTQ